MVLMSASLKVAWMSMLSPWATGSPLNVQADAARSTSTPSRAMLKNDRFNVVGFIDFTRFPFRSETWQNAFPPFASRSRDMGGVESLFLTDLFHIRDPQEIVAQPPSKKVTLQS